MEEVFFFWGGVSDIPRGERSWSKKRVRHNVSAGRKVGGRDYIFCTCEKGFTKEKKMRTTVEGDLGGGGGGISSAKKKGVFKKEC